MKSRSYVDEFLQLNCAGDVLESVGRLRSPAKEISEAMTLIHAIRSRILRAPGDFNVIELCAGNALTAILAVHLLKVNSAVAVDKKARNRESFNRVAHFAYKVASLGDGLWEEIALVKNPIIVTTHADEERALALAVECKARDIPMAIIPCCPSRKVLPTDFIKPSVVKRYGIYQSWLMNLAITTGGRFSTATRSSSPCNGVVTRGL